MLIPIYLLHDHFYPSFRSGGLGRYEQLVADIFSILSDESTLKYLPDKRVNDLEEAEAFLQAVILNYHAGLNYLHFITDQGLGRVIGMIDLISPSLARKHYDFNRYPYFIKFYLSSPMTGCSIMTRLLTVVVDAVFSQSIPRIGAVMHQQNTAARRVLEKSRFRY
jgi:RimJ/RimL family protein N-acetyltransferase